MTLPDFIKVRRETLMPGKDRSSANIALARMRQTRAARAVDIRKTFTVIEGGRKG